MRSAPGHEALVEFVGGCIERANEHSQAPRPLPHNPRGPHAREHPRSYQSTPYEQSEQSVFEDMPALANGLNYWRSGNTPEGALRAEDEYSDHPQQYGHPEAPVS